MICFRDFIWRVPHNPVKTDMEKRTRKEWIIRLVILMAGFVMGGTVGIGTLICVVLVGPVAGIFLPVNEKLVERILRHEILFKG